MITRILGEGRYAIADEHLDRLNQPDAVRSLGTPLPDERITPSDPVLPDEATSRPQVRELLSDEGLIPG